MTNEKCRWKAFNMIIISDLPGTGSAIVEIWPGHFFIFDSLGSFLPDDKITMLILFFLGFAALDFWMPVMIKKKAAQDQAMLDAQRKALGAANDPSAQSQPPKN